jgi:hypothetical protein
MYVQEARTIFSDEHSFTQMVVAQLWKALPTNSCALLELEGLILAKVA